MKILHVIQRYWPYLGGSERHFQEVSERLARAGHQVTVYTTDAFELELFWNPTKARVQPSRETHNGVTIVRFPVRHLRGRQLAHGGIRRGMGYLGALGPAISPLQRYLARFVPWVPNLTAALDAESDRANDFDIVNGMNICFESLLLPAQRFARRRGIPFLITPLIHLGESDHSLVRRFYTMPHQIQMIAHADAVLAQNTIERDYLIGRGVRPEKISIAGVGVNPEEVLGGQGERIRARLRRSGPLVAYVGTLAYDKGTVHLVEAMRRLWREGSAADLVLAGQSLDTFHAYLDTLSRFERERIHLLGYVDEATKRDIFAASDVFAMPSRTDSFGIVYLESWLYRKPVIGARAGGVTATIDDGVDGFLIPFGDVPALANRLARLIGDPDGSLAMGERGRDKVLARYTWDRVFPRIEEVYQWQKPQVTAR
ncbi:MAG TPA: glycosyltransferase family 4 protein [Chloroflexota bacterium]|nr:glycosyltransferase family 4 protein [Chloroflexota bacterium]